MGLEPGKALHPLDAAAGADWQALLRDSAGSAARSLLSAPLGYGVTALFKALVPDAQTSALQEVRDIVRRIETGVTQGIAQIDAHLARLEHDIAAGFRQLSEEVFESRLSEPLGRIDYFARRFSEERDFRLDNAQTVEIDLRVEAICGSLLHAPLSDQRRGYLAAAAASLCSAYPADGFASLDLLRAAEALSARFSSALLAALRGLTLVEAALKLSQGQAAAKARRSKFLGQQLPALLDAYQHSVETLVLGALAQAPTQGEAADAARWRDLVDCAFHVFRQADQTVVGAACHLSGAAPPKAWLSGRVIGSARAVAWGTQRLEGLRALCKEACAPLALAGLGAPVLVRHSGLQLVELRARGQVPSGPPLLIERDDSDVHLLRYALAGFDAAFQKELDALCTSADGAAVSPLALRGTPALGRIGTHAVAWDAAFRPIVLDFADLQPTPDSRHRAELALALPLPPLAATRAPRSAPWQLDPGVDAACQAQLADAAQQAWNRVHRQPGGSPAGAAPQPPQPPQPLRTLPPQAADITALALSHDGQTLACGLADGHITVWDARDGVARRQIAAHAGAVHCLAFSRDDLLLLSGGEDHAIGVWALADGRALHRMTHHCMPVTMLTGLPDTDHMLSVGHDGVNRIDPAGGTVVGTLTRHGRSAAVVAATADPAVYVYGDQGGYVQLIDIGSGRDLPGGAYEDPMAQPAEPLAAVTQVLMTPTGGRLLVLAGPTRRAAVWDLRARRHLHLLGGEGFRPSRGLLQDEGHQVLLAEPEGRLQLCDVATGTVLREGRCPGRFGALVAGSGGWWLGSGRQLSCWPDLQLPAGTTPAAPQDAAARQVADLGAWLEAAAPSPADLLDARGIVAVHSRHPDAARDARERRRGSQWVALSTQTGHTLSWCYETRGPADWPPRADDRSVHADGPALPWVAGESLSTAFGKFRDERTVHGFFRMERVGPQALTLQTATGLYLTIDKDGRVTLSEQQDPGCALRYTPLAAGQIMLRDDAGRDLRVPLPVGSQAPHDPRTIVLDTPRVEALAAAKVAPPQPAPSRDEACRFTLHFAEPAVSARPAWLDGSVLDAWHRHTVHFTDGAMSGFGGHGESRAWHCELLRRRASGRIGLTTADSAPPARLKVEVWGLRQLVSGELDRAASLANGTIKHRVFLHLGRAAQPGQVPEERAFKAIRAPDFDVYERFKPETGSKKAPPLTQGPDEASFYAAGVVEVQPADSLWLRVTVELREDWWTREPNSWATLGVRIRDLRLSWA